MKQSPTDVAREVYRETLAFYEEKAPQLGDAACGFRIFYAPPIYRPSTLFIGYQPGGDARDIDDEQHHHWPAESEYVEQKWKLAARMRQVWSPTELERSTGLNAIFFRAPSALAWASVSDHLRREITTFCDERVKRIVRSLCPERIVFIGLRTLRLYVSDRSVALAADQRLLIEEGRLWNFNAYGVLHLSGARIRADHFKAMKTFFAEPLPTASE